MLFSFISSIDTILAKIMSVWLGLFGFRSPHFESGSDMGRVMLVTSELFLDLANRLFGLGSGGSVSRRVRIRQPYFGCRVGFGQACSGLVKFKSLYFKFF